MKKQLTTAMAKKICTFLFAAISLAASQTAFALPDTATKLKGAEITYKGVQDKNLVFNVSYSNPPAQSFQLLVKNEQNEIIYLKKFDSQPLQVKMLFSEVPANCRLTFIIRYGKEEVTQAFEINTQVKTVEEFIVKGI